MFGNDRYLVQEKQWNVFKRCLDSLVGEIFDPINGGFPDFKEKYYECWYLYFRALLSSSYASPNFLSSMCSFDNSMYDCSLGYLFIAEV